jgi:hypothetical protein
MPEAAPNVNVAKDFVATLVLRGADLSYNNSVPALRWNVERLGRFLDGFPFVGRVDGTEVFSTLPQEFSTLPQDIHAPSGQHQNALLPLPWKVAPQGRAAFAAP